MGKDSIKSVKARITAAYLLIVFFAFMALTAAALMIQVELTDKSAM
jgi:heme/copper-type cytochrome/quinol oxidase subunit 1